MAEAVATLKDNGRSYKPFDALDDQLHRFLVTTRNITVETSISDPLEEQPCSSRLGGSGLLKGGLLQAGSITTSPPDAVVPASDYDQVYVRNLMATLRGYPFWSPTLFPQPSIPVERSRLGVIVGDVGLIHGPGSFSVLFNIFQYADHPLNKGKVPDNFVPFQLNSTRYVSRRVFQNDAHIVSPSVRVAHKEESDSGDRSTVQFEADGPEGVVLGLPCGATSEDLIDMSGLRQYIADNIFSWYVFLRKVKKWQCDNGDIRIVIGTDKSTAWTQSTFVSLDGVSKDNFRIKLTTTQKRGGGVICGYDCSGSCYKILGGPSSDFLEEIRDPDDNSSDYCSQTLFIRTINPMLGDHYWEASRTGNNPPSAITMMRRRNFARVTSRFPLPLKVIDWTQSASVSLRKLWPATEDAKPKVIITGLSYSQANHPSNILNRKLLKKMPYSKLVMTDDYDWLSCARADDKFSPNTSEIIADRVFRDRAIGNYRGITFLSIQSPAVFS